MSEEKKEEQGTSEDAGEGSESEPASEADKANAAAERLEDANKKQEGLLEREEALQAQRKLGGGSPAGQVKKKETEDEKWEKDAKERYEGTGMDPTPDDSPTEFK